MGKLDLYTFGHGGVNLTKGPHHLADDELVQAQNAEMVPDSARGGEFVLAKRGGMESLNADAIGSILGFIGLKLDGEDEAEEAVAATPSLLNQFWFGWMSGIQNTTIDVMGAYSGIVATGATQTRVHTSTLPYIDISTATNTTAQQCSITAASSGSPFQFRHNPTVDFFILSPSSLSTVRVWFGIGIGDLTADSDTDPVTSGGEQFIAFRFSSNASDTKWQFVTRDSGGTTTVTDSGVTVATSTAYHLKMRIVDGTGVAFSINEGAETTVTLTLPTSTDILKPSIVCRKFVTGGAEARSFGFQRMICRLGTAGTLT